MVLLLVFSLSVATLWNNIHLNSFQIGVDKADRLYEELTDMEKITGVLQDYLDDYNIVSAKEVKLVFFQDAIEHVSR